MMTSSATKTHSLAREKLFNAAGEIFAECGFRGATVRDICRRADMNIASIKYHFGDKESLYAEVLQTTYMNAFERFPPTLDVDENSTTEERLHAFVRSFLLRVLDAGWPAWHGQLLAREIIEPSFAFDAMIRDFIRPSMQVIVPIVREILGDRAEQAQVLLSVRSVIGQCLFYLHAQDVMRAVEPAHAPGGMAVDLLADHIVTFSLGALRQFSPVTKRSNKTKRGEVAR